MQGTIIEMFIDAGTKYGDRTGYTYRGDDGSWTEVTFEQAFDRARNIGNGLIDMGMAPGDRVAILSNTNVEWTLVDHAVLGGGGIVVPIYQTNSPQECEYIINNCGVSFVVVENAEQLAKIAAISEQCESLKHVIVMNGDKSDEWPTTLADVEATGAKAEDAWTDRCDGIKPEQMATYIYTSGTTGPPKGCMLTHQNYRDMSDSVGSLDNIFDDRDRVVLFLPLAHTFARLIGFLVPKLGLTMVISTPATVLDDLAETNPHILPSVPRVFEKAYNKVQATLAEATGAKAKIADWAMKVGRLRGKYVQAGRTVPPLLAVQWKIAYALVFKKIHERFGGEVRYAVSGGAPLSAEIHEFFLTAGMVILEGYGLTESTTALCLSRPGEFASGAVGPALPGVELKIADDGEILARGTTMFQGYYGNEAATRETLDEDGWLHTGDIGHIERGLLYITDRKKDIIVTAGGKNIAPQLIENGLKAQPLISQAAVIGDKRPFLTAIVTLDPEDAEALADELNLPKDMVELIDTDEVKSRVAEAFAHVNGEHGRVGQVKRWRILPIDFSQEAGELTPTLKLKRKFVGETYEQVIEEMYSDGAPDEAAVTEMAIVHDHAERTRNSQAEPVST